MLQVYIYIVNVFAAARKHPLKEAEYESTETSAHQPPSLGTHLIIIYVAYKYMYTKLHCIIRLNFYTAQSATDPSKLSIIEQGNTKTTAFKE